MSFNFTKWHGLGNDFVIVDLFKENISDCNNLAIKVCDRNFGIGADGMVLVGPSTIADFKMQIFNSDGSEAEMCGNVTRCVARYVYENNLTAKTKFKIETKAGIITPEVIIEDNVITLIKVDMGEPILKSEQIPVALQGYDKIVSYPLMILEEKYEITCVSMGNPHCVIFVDDLDKVKLTQVGPVIETHNLFPKKINVEFAQVINDEYIKMRVWERGAGVTLACGTGSCATLVAAVLTGKTNKKALVELDGGNLNIEWAENNHIYMSGPAQLVFKGVYLA